MSTRVSKRSASTKSSSIIDEDDDDVEISQPSKKARTKRVNASRDIYEEDEDDEDDEQVDESKVFETGQIKKIHMENFMCHRKFTMDFGRHLNFINGSNGSGKSAIAGALQICLGARASVTGRGSQIAKYVREGAEKHEHALIQVTLRNEGSDAYDQKTYGKKITIERKFNKESGAGGYVIKNQDMQVVSREKKVLQEILASFNIQVDNPCCVLTQEESKKFIQGSDKEKFQFFMRATGLDTLSDELLDLKTNLVLTAEEIERAKLVYVDMKKDYKSWKEILTKLMQLEKIDQEINKCYVKIAWCKVHNKGEEVRLSGERHESVGMELVEARSEAEKVGNEGFYQEKLQQIQQQQQELQGELDSFEEPNKTARTSLQTTKNRILDLTAELKDLNYQKAELKRRHDEAQAKRQSLLDRRLKDAHSEERKLLQNANDITSDLESTKAAIEQQSSQSMDLQQQRASLQTRISTCSVEISNITSEHQKLSKELRELTSGGNSEEQRIRRIGGDWAVKLLEKISKESFRRAPVGPVGVHVAIQEGQNSWSANLEKSLGSFLLTGFVVTNREDNIKLKTLMRSVSDKCNFTVFQQPEAPRYQVRSVSDIAASRGYNNLVCPLDLLQIQNDLVFNLVVDNSGLESIAYWRGSDQQLTQDLTSTSAGNKLALKYDIKHVLLEDGMQYNVVNGLESRQANRATFKNYLAADSNAAINALQERITSLDQELDHNQQQKNCLLQELKLVNESLSGIDGKLKVNRDKLKTLMKKKQELDGRLSEVQDSNNMDVSLFDGEIADLKMATDQLEVDIGNLKSSLEEEARAEKVKRAAVQEMDAKKGRSMAALTALEDDLKKTVAAQRSYKIEQAQLVKKVLNLDAQWKAAADDLSKKEGEYEKEFEAAECLSRERWPDWDEQPIALSRKETIPMLEKQANAFIQEKNDSKKKQGIADITIAQANEKTIKAQKDYKDKGADIEESERRLGILQEDAKARKAKLLKTRNRYQEIVRNRFEAYLKKRNFTGSVRFDFEAQSMTMEVQTHRDDRNTKVSDVKNLSGGERSFATYCFLLALGHVIESSFRIMDEYDVFMDEITRKETIQMMEGYVKAPDQQGRQFILLTPNNLSHVSVSDQVRVKKMPEPERRASARGLQQQTID